MSPKSWKAKVKLSNGSLQDIVVNADNSRNATAIIEAQYGKGSIRFGPMEVR